MREKACFSAWPFHFWPTKKLLCEITVIFFASTSRSKPSSPLDTAEAAAATEVTSPATADTSQATDTDPRKDTKEKEEKKDEKDDGSVTQLPSPQSDESVISLRQQLSSSAQQRHLHSHYHSLLLLSTCAFNLFVIYCLFIPNLL